jgi:hypothetical protein
VESSDLFIRNHGTQFCFSELEIHLRAARASMAIAILFIASFFPSWDFAILSRAAARFRSISTISVLREVAAFSVLFDFPYYNRSSCNVSLNIIKASVYPFFHGVNNISDMF